MDLIIDKAITRRKGMMNVSPCWVYGHVKCCDDDPADASVRGKIKLYINHFNGGITAHSHKSSWESEGVPVLDRNSGKAARYHTGRQSMLSLWPVSFCFLFPSHLRPAFFLSPRQSSSFSWCYIFSQEFTKKGIIRQTDRWTFQEILCVIQMRWNTGAQ